MIAVIQINLKSVHIHIVNLILQIRMEGPHAILMQQNNCHKINVSDNVVNKVKFNLQSIY